MEEHKRRKRYSGTHPKTFEENRSAAGPGGVQSQWEGAFYKAALGSEGRKTIEKGIAQVTVEF